jgi:hypothetical protein
MDANDEACFVSAFGDSFSFFVHLGFRNFFTFVSVWRIPRVWMPVSLQWQLQFDCYFREPNANSPHA